METLHEVNERIRGLRKSLSTAKSILGSLRREPRDNLTLAMAEKEAEQHLLALEIWAASQTHE